MAEYITKQQVIDLVKSMEVLIGCTGVSVLTKCIEGMEATEGQQHWISVKDRMPEENTAVIACDNNGIVFQCLYAYDGWDLWEGNKVTITHWMPLPKPPKE